ncbi:Gldg family protein [bacterium AH-315-E10]|nr:Gldg family protein [bacterium AH-315-E10]
MKFRSHVIAALFKQNLGRYFNNPTAYVFITIFIVASAVLQFSWGDQFFVSNLAELTPLNQNIPYLLLFFIPVLTMGIWSEEKRLGTDEFLLTLPATDFEITVSKYMSITATYLASLFFSLTIVIAISCLGKPDMGLILCNYISYILLGCTMLAIGMLASILTQNATIAFIIGVLFNSALLFSGFLGSIGDSVVSIKPLASFMSVLGFNENSGMLYQFREISSGVISIASLVYFISITAVMIYITMIVLGKRHWNTGRDNDNMKLHYIVRTICLFAIVLSLNIILNRFYLRIDMSSEGIHSFSPTTQSLVTDLKRPVLIQAYISPEVPTDLVEARTNLISQLKEISALSGGKIQVIFHDTEPKSKEARDAKDKFNILPQKFPETKNGQSLLKEVFMGVAFTSGANQEVTSFIGPRLPVEYELARSIRVVSEAKRAKVGVLKTDARVKGGMDFGGPGGMRQIPDWQVVSELEKQYEVVEVNADADISNDIDVLLAILPSSLTQSQMDNLKAFILAGGKTMLLVDPLPAINPSLSPHLPKPQPQANPFMMGRRPPSGPPKGDLDEFLADIGVTLEGQTSKDVIWCSYNPHPRFNLEKEFPVISAANDGSINSDSNITNGLQELVAIFAGSLKPNSAAAWATFTPLLKTGGGLSGSIDFDMLMPSRFGPPKNKLYKAKDGRITIAAHITGRYKAPMNTDKKDEKEQTTPAAADINVVIMSDLDFIGDQFFMLRASGPKDLNFDNVNFFLNSIDVLSGEDSFLELRKKRSRHRSLEWFDKVRETLYKKQSDLEEKAEKTAKEELEAAQKRFDDKVAAIRNRTDIKSDEKNIMVQTIQLHESRLFEVKKTEIELEKERKIETANAKMAQDIKAKKQSVVIMTILLPPLLPLLLAVFVFFRRRHRELAGLSKSRMREA